MPAEVHGVLLFLLLATRSSMKKTKKTGAAAAALRDPPRGWAGAGRCRGPGGMAVA